MRKYNVGLEIHGKQVKVGTIEGESFESAQFAYSDEYISGADAYPISVALPLQREPFSSRETGNFFDGLLPEGFMRRSIAGNMHFDERDYLSILHNLGKECLGALRIYTDDEEKSFSYEPLSAGQVEALASEGATKSTELVIKTHLSLTGASGKVGLYYDETANRWYLPVGLAPSTHIVKQSHIRLDGIVTNEQLSMLTASKCGVQIPQSFIINMGEGQDSEVLFATKRYDRTFDGAVDSIDGLTIPLRIHQEDFAQAMGVASFDKYEKEGQNYAPRMFEILRMYATNPLEDQLALWRRIVFNYAIGNTDSHIKNFSLLYNPDMTGVRLGPAYDIIGTLIYESATRELSFNIGGVRNIEEVKRDSFVTMAGMVGIGEKPALRVYDEVLEGFEAALKESAKELTEIGFVNAGGICERILQSRKKML
ncbi:MAG: HipA domain-containing protein [Butyrivibrio sp.]|nr:HipA domain-containing protein [Butyrivibrio sp.]